LETLRDNNACRRALASLLNGLRPADFGLPMTMVHRDGTRVESDTTGDFLYNRATGQSTYLNTYDSVTMEATGRSGRQGNFITYGQSSGGTQKYGITITPPSIFWNREFFDLSQNARAHHTIHEIIHQWATDIEIANQIAIMDRDLDRNTNRPRTFLTTAAASAYFNDWLARQCGLPQN